jgi:acetylornithine deacetylase/succinyl-diaminopimelate desuccinylase-like protein
MMQEQVTYYGIEVGTKLSVAVRLAAPSREALQKARIALEPRMSPRREPERVIPAVRRFFRDIAPLRREFRDELADIDAAIAAGDFWRLPVGYLELTQNNIFAEAVTERPEGGFEMRTVMINLPDEDADRLIADLETRVRPFGVKIAAIEEKIGPVPTSPTETLLWNLLAEEAAATFRTRVGTEVLNRSVSDSRFLRQTGIVAYGITPFAVDFFQSDSIHGTDERLRVEYFTAGVAFMRRLIARWAVTENVTGA